ADGGLVADRVSGAQAWSDAAIPAGNEASRILPTGAETGEPERAEPAVGAGIRTRRVEVRVLIGLAGRRQGEVVTQAEVDGQLAGDAPVVLHIKAEIWIPLGNVANRLSAAEVGFAQQERGERAATTGGKGGGAGDAG